MFETAGKTKIAAALASFGLVVGMSTSSAFADDMGFVSGKGVGVKTNYGECWNAKGGVSQIGDCGVQPMMDSDGDGVPDDRDQCPNTPKGVAVDENGCPLDSDGDGVPDYLDECPNTPAGAKVDSRGCEIIGDLTLQVTADSFDFDSAVIKQAMMTQLDDVAEQVATSKGDETLTVVGHTDSTGPADYNQGLSERRAQAVADYLIANGVSASRVTVKGMGESSPVADNSTREGRAMNRRVEILSN